MISKIRKNCMFDNKTLNFIEAYAQSLGSISFSGAVENLVLKGIANIKEQEAMNEKFLVAHLSLESSILKQSELIKSQNERLISVMNNIGNVLHLENAILLVKEIYEDKNLKNKTPQEAMIKAGIFLNSYAKSKRKEDISTPQNKDYLND
ncbi:hypothetical protein [Sulfurospirillum barnesii]|uniref:Uncharacterized protein n=1 Tax=Sulfurospirillum barnesii (strain ATCC 700032 / DSM 10660 / SES-3) TaxID=760154 RepID=I3XZL7_SULBS|nr:hypothetical protein [Sulfurospirillum barnesii]AFL69391.1 hypothetical protein Sulba_2113 [Sulfurospirillum barnesii SES-3]